jgi:hypothetical protein
MAEQEMGGSWILKFGRVSIPAHGTHRCWSWCPCNLATSESGQPSWKSLNKVLKKYQVLISKVYGISSVCVCVFFCSPSCGTQQISVAQASQISDRRNILG